MTNKMTDTECADQLQSYLDFVKEHDPAPWPRGINGAVAHAISRLRNPNVGAQMADGDRVQVEPFPDPSTWISDPPAPWSYEVHFLRSLANDPALNLEQGATLRHCANRIERTAHVSADQSSAAAPAAVPEGMVLVPREPTPEMIAQGCAEYWGDGWEESEHDGIEQARRTDADNIYRAMLAASPAPAAEAERLHTNDFPDRDTRYYLCWALGVLHEHGLDEFSLRVQHMHDEAYRHLVKVTTEPAAPSVPEGMAIVPRIPTRAMLDALYGGKFQRFEDAFADMLKVAEAPAPEVSEAEDEQCESGLDDCGPVEHWDSEAVPLCRRCYDELANESAPEVSS